MGDIKEAEEMLSSEAFDFKYECGVVAMPESLPDCKKLVSAVCKHFGVVKVLPQLYQLQEGLGTLNVIDLIRINSVTLRSLFIKEMKAITSDDLFDLFEPERVKSTTGTRMCVAVLGKLLASCGRYVYIILYTACIL